MTNAGTSLGAMLTWDQPLLLAVACVHPLCHWMQLDLIDSPFPPFPQAQEL